MVKVRARSLEPQLTSAGWLAWWGNHMADLTAAEIIIITEMLKVDGGSFRRAEAAKHQAVTLQRLAQHVGC
eukprot:3182970-Amphidinium_carterae.1